MGQFSVYKNANPASRARVPLLMDVQTELLDALDTRWVVPLLPVSGLRGKPMRIVTPVLAVDGKSYVLMTPELAGVPHKVFGAKVADLSDQRAEIVAALDMMFTGI